VRQTLFLDYKLL